MNIRQQLAHVVTRYDRKRYGKRGYNPYALGLYLKRSDEVAEQVAKGADLEAAIRSGFNDRLRDHVLKSFGFL